MFTNNLTISPVKILVFVLSSFHYSKFRFYNFFCDSLSVFKNPLMQLFVNTAYEFSFFAKTSL